MATYYGTARSNYFSVRDEIAFRTWAKTLPGVHVRANGSGHFALFADEHGWPVYRDEDDDSNDGEIDVCAELSTHLADGEIAVLFEVGAEKLRYLNGWAEAFDSKYNKIMIRLDDIYELAERQFGKMPKRAEGD